MISSVRLEQVLKTGSESVLTDTFTEANEANVW